MPTAARRVEWWILLFGLRPGDCSSPVSILILWQNPNRRSSRSAETSLGAAGMSARATTPDGRFLRNEMGAGAYSVLVTAPAGFRGLGRSRRGSISSRVAVL